MDVALLNVILAVFALLPLKGLQGEVEEGSEIITTAAEVRMLPVDELAKSLPVRLRGTYIGEADPEGIAFIMQDDTEAIYAQAPAESLIGIERGDIIEIKGVSNPGGFAPIVLAQSLEKVGHGEIPAPKKITLDELYAGQLDGQWVEFSGIVRSVEPKVSTDAPPPPPGTLYKVPSVEPQTKVPEVKMKLASGLGRVMVEVNGPLDPQAYVDAEVRLQGLCFNLHNRNRQYVKPFVQVPLGAKIVIEKPPVKDLFESEPQPIQDLLRFGKQNDKNGHRVHIQGTVIHHRPGLVLWVRDGEHCLRIESKQNEILHPGDMVDVLGFPVPGEYSPILEDAVYRKRSSGPIPEPLTVSNITGALDNDANLIQFDAKLIELRSFHGGLEVTMEVPDHTLRAYLYQSESNPVPANWLPGSVIRVRGVCEVTADEQGPLGGLWIPRSFELLLRSPDDIAVVRPPPWWNAERIAWILLWFLVLALVVIAFVIWLSRRRMQEQEHRRAMAEAEFSAILNERNRMAREIHDTLSQSLGSISMQLELARTHADELSSEVRNHMGTAHQLTRDALKEARNSIWNMRSHVLENADLGEAFSRILRQLTEDSEIQFEVNVEGQRRRLSPMFENNLLRIGQEAITNAYKHANPKHIRVKLEYLNRRLRLTIKDDGVGIIPGKTDPQPAGRRSFGLVGMRERVELLGGTFQVVSSPEKGTEIIVMVHV